MAMKKPAYTNNQTLLQLRAEIERLQREAEKVKAKEKSEVLTRITEAISVYGITREELFPKRGYGGRGNKKPVAVKAAPAAKKSKAVKVVAKKSKAAKKATAAKRVRRVFSEDQKANLAEQHRTLVAGGMSLAAAAKKLDVVDSLMRKWQDKYPAQKKAA